jgi:predicted nucleic acid-binding protein
LKFVLDTNVILKALIKDSRVRAILIGSGHEFLMPEEAIEGIRRHSSLVEEKSGLPHRSGFIAPPPGTLI